MPAAHAAGAMRVLFDSYWWFDGPTSLRNVVRSLVRTWAEEHPEDRLTLTAKPDQVETLRAALGDLGIAAEIVPVPRWARIHALAATSTARHAARHDVVIAQNFSARGRGALSVTFVHDAMYVEHPEWFLPVERAYLAGIRPLLRRADLVFTSSRTEAARIARVWPETSARVRPVGLHAPRDFLEVSEKRPDGIGDGPYLLVVGRLNVRKNLARLVEAFLRSRISDDARLLVVGQRDGLGSLLEPGDDRVVLLDAIDDAELKWLYRNARAFVFPSLDEGFGLPLVEAHTTGTPILASDIPVFRELGLADASFDPESVDDIVRALDALSAEPAAVRRTPPPAVTSWSDTVAQMRAAIVETRGAAAGAATARR
ncbi:MAG: hypothetical protein DI534_13610 [Leifsonia xyli]|nr:MAG: hypothetical protein DI534_13610 [Leifsonia xyli]